MTWREYHESTKHTTESLSRFRHALDWENMPAPFRHYEGSPMLDLPADPPAPKITTLDLLQGTYGTTPVADGPTFLSQLLFYSAAISASKRVPSTRNRYALRVNPSSGNLHPTEFHFLARGLMQWPDGLYHYRPSSHMAEQRAVGDFAINQVGSGSSIVFVLTSIAWREAWKYQDRAYRYCLHDMGHAWQSIALAAQAIGCRGSACGHFPDDEMARFLQLNVDEWPMLIVELHGSSIPVRPPDGGEKTWSGGCANELSTQPVSYPLIDGIHAATKRTGSERGGISATKLSPVRSGEVQLPAPASSNRSFAEVARARRSALDFRRDAGPMSLAQLSAILAVTARPLLADFAETRFIQLYLYVHQVDGLRPGVYRYWPEHAQLEQIRSGDQRVAAAGLSLGQNLAGNACVAFSMVADLHRATRSHGDRGYRYVHFEAGALGQRLYLAAEALGLGATGIGAFFDDEVHRYLHLAPEREQVVYHFAIGYPIPDPRIGGSGH